MKTHFLLVKDDFLQILNEGVVNWSPPFPSPWPYGLPIAHALFGDEKTIDLMQPVKEFQKIFPKRIHKRRVSLCLPDDYSPVEKRAILDFVQIACSSKDITAFSYADCVAFGTNKSDYIALTASRRYVTMSKIKQGQMEERVFLLWPETPQGIPELLRDWQGNPVYLCDPNGLLVEFLEFGIEVCVNEELFERLMHVERRGWNHIARS